MSWTIKESLWLEGKIWYGIQTYKEQKEESENKKIIPLAN